MSIIITVLLLGIIVFIHEFGHFITAKIFHMPILEFAVGIGPKLISKKVNTTVYSIRAIPFGGFVSIDGMEVETGNKVENGFNTQNPIKRLIVLGAGVTMNFLSGIFVLFILFTITKTVPPASVIPKVKTVLENTRSKNIIKPGDIITDINGTEIRSWKDLTDVMGKINAENYNDQDIEVKVTRENKEETLKTKLTYNEENKIYILGIEPEIPHMNILERAKLSVVSFFSILSEMLKGIVSLFTGKVSMNQLTGPVGLTKVVGQAYSSGGFIILLNFFVLLSINIGLINLLPFPALDGGRIIFVLLELVGIKVNKKIEEKVHIIGFTLLIMLMALIVFNDIRNF